MNDEATRRSYDTVAEEYAARLHDELAAKPLDRALLATLLEQTAAGAAVADLGCGPGHVAAWLAEHGAKAVGIDLSAGMVAVAGARYPQVEFRQGDLRGLPAADGEFGAVVALYSIIHLASEDLPRALAEIRRVLRPSSGLLLLSFHVGDEIRHLDEWWGHEVDVDFHFLDPDRITSLVEAAGLTVEARLERAPYPHEAETRRAYLFARRL
ncbi:class I SAM-dependent methyltransferase [Streptomyces sp. 8K308]|uniref:class I SAM-dependent methyltransferase n=1 Tax=Streptomyces sp. 8K308 TaxID=2530388 RepID=UPI0010439988|nr:class I SAM-dependent methyltransferase [Streptomyces sp. 8K308]TDC26344.1 class I SAM-dependent methyltransferase [Streptomyces sp. 8K308]